ncbi:hypothetical protein V1520DRAFT_187716 [Lipomyces starkeyi]
MSRTRLWASALPSLSWLQKTDKMQSPSSRHNPTSKISQVIPGVVSEEINEKAYPRGSGLKKLLTTEYQSYLGSWRTHEHFQIHH